MERELLDLRPYAGCLRTKSFQSKDSLGRRDPSKNDDDGHYFGIIDPLIIDHNKILNSKSYRRLPRKTQVFPLPDNFNVRNRLTHSAGVNSLAVRMAEIVGLNSWLVSGMSWVHDFGHVPFGHLGERTISELWGYKFRHEIFSVVVAQKIERRGLGLNLIFEILEGALKHSRGAGTLDFSPDSPLEYGLVMLSDKIDYTFADINDCLRLEYLTEKDLPPEYSRLGGSQRQCLANCEYALVKESAERGYISFSNSSVAEDFERLRQWMYDNVYSELDKHELRRQYVEAMLKVIRFFEKFDFFSIDPILLLALMTDDEVVMIAGMSDNFTIGDLKCVLKMGFAEIAQNLPKGIRIDLGDPALDWGYARREANKQKNL